MILEVHNSKFSKCESVVSRVLTNFGNYAIMVSSIKYSGRTSIKTFHL